jgi:hypothetical protein
MGDISDFYGLTKAELESAKIAEAARSERARPGPAWRMRIPLLLTPVIVGGLQPFYWDPQSVSVLFKCAGLACLAWGITSRAFIDLMQQAIAGMGQVLGPLFKDAFTLAAVGIGLALLFAIPPHVVIAAAVIILVLVAVTRAW